MASKQLINSQIQDWETPAPVGMTEKEKREFTRNRIEQDLAGNPNMRSTKPRVPKFKPPTEEDVERMKKLDSMGNPKPGYKWQGLTIVEDNGSNNTLGDFAKVTKLKNKKLDIDPSAVQIIKTNGMKFNPKNLIEVEKDGIVISGDGKRQYKFKKK